MVEELAARLGAGRFARRYAGRIAEARGPAGPVALLIPTTFMNDSGGSVGPAAGALRVPPAGVLVVHDEIDLPFGTVRGKEGGGVAGHNGLRAVRAGLGSADFPRVRVGVGRPPAEFRGDEADWVLMRFTEPAEEVRELLGRATAMAVLAVAEGMEAAIARFHAAEPGSRARRRRERTGEAAGEDEGGEVGGNPGAGEAPAPCPSRASREGEGHG